MGRKASYYYFLKFSDLVHSGWLGPINLRLIYVNGFYLSSLFFVSSGGILDISSKIFFFQRLN